MVVIATVVGYRLDVGSQSILDEKKHCIAVTPHFHIRFSGAGMWFYSADLPYHGSVWLMGDDKGAFYNHGHHMRPTRDLFWHAGRYGILGETYIGESGEIVVRRKAADFPGVYFRRFEWTGQYPDWTLMVSCWYPFLLFAFLPVLRISRWWRSRPKHFVQPTPTHKTTSSG